MPAVIALGANGRCRLTEIPGMVPSLTNLPEGCALRRAVRLRSSAAVRNIRRCRTWRPSSRGLLARGRTGEGVMSETRRCSR
jgi:hypothetical protein